MKKFYLFLIVLLNIACSPKKIVQNNYVLEKRTGMDIPVCVNHPVILIEKEKSCINSGTCKTNMCGVPVVDPGVYEESPDICDKLSPQIVSYTYCLQTAANPIHLVIKTEKDMTICYDRNNNIRLPIAYCLPDTNVNVDVDVTTKTSVTQYQHMKNVNNLLIL